MDYLLDIQVIRNHGAGRKARVKIPSSKSDTGRTPGRKPNSLLEETFDQSWEFSDNLVLLQNN